MFRIGVGPFPPRSEPAQEGQEALAQGPATWLKGWPQQQPAVNKLVQGAVGAGKPLCSSAPEYANRNHSYFRWLL